MFKMMNEKEKLMRKAMEIAEKGRGFVNPNPLVGALIIKNGKIIGEGYHKKFGDNHAEINAFYDAEKRGHSVQGADMYVTLEPCSHYGKTPPCAKKIVEKGIKKVFIGILDPNPLVSGKGISILKHAGIDVETDILSEELRKQNEVFLHFIKEKTPFCLLKTAMSLDGKIATHSGDSQWITDEYSRRYVHKMRHSLMGIMVGINTVLKDNPKLNTRLDGKEINSSDTIKIIVDSEGKIPLDCNIIKNIKNSDKEVIIATTNRIKKNKEKDLIKEGVKILKIKETDEKKVDLKELMKELGKMNIDSILLEGGGNLNFSALKSDIVNKVVAFIAPKIIGGNNALTPVEGLGVNKINESFLLREIRLKKLENDIVIEGYIRKDKKECLQD